MHCQFRDDDQALYAVTITKTILELSADQSLAPGFEFTGDPTLVAKLARDGVNRFTLQPGFGFDNVTTIEKVRVLPCADQPNTFRAIATRVSQRCATSTEATNWPHAPANEA